MYTAIDSFKAAMHLAGIEHPDTIIADGTIHRFHIQDDKKASKNGWYILHADFPPAGAFGCWKRGINKIFSTPIHQNHVDDRIMQAERIDSIKHGIDRDREKQAAISLWEQATPATNGCQYLKTKQVQSHGLRYFRNALLVPVMDCDGEIYGVQRIWPNGSKRNVTGSDMLGHFYKIGTPQNDLILIAEGYSTAATLHEVTGHAVVAAFSCDNLQPVAEVLRVAYPDHRIFICTDDDHSEEGNPGLTAATKTAQAVGVLLAVPVFANTRSDRDSDFNDLYRVEGADSVRNCLQAAGVNHVQGA